jgi:hypothetical protein
MRNPYNTNLRTNMDLKMNASLGNGWEDELDADLRRLVLEHADRTVMYRYYEHCAMDVPPELVPAENMEYYKATAVERGVELPSEQITFEVDTVRSLMFARERHGILGPLTVTFAEVVDHWWWGFRDDDELDNDDEGTLNLDPDIISAALDEVHEYMGITRIRLVPVLNPHTFEPDPAVYRFELMRDGVHGQQRMLITLPRPFITHIEPDIDTVIRDMQERLHLRLAVVENGVYEFSV